MAGKDDRSDPSHLEDIPHERTEPRPDFSKPLPRQKLNKALSDSLEKNEKESWSGLYEGTAPESTESNVRYAAYASRIRTILLSAHRYVAYTSDIGESFRPVAHPYMVKGAYAVSWLYLVGDVGHEGYKAWVRNQRVLHPEKYAEEEKNTTHAEGVGGKIKGAAHELQTALVPSSSAATSTDSLTPGKVVPIEDYRAVMVQRGVFQAIASMGLPAFTIHSIVKYSGRAMKNVKAPKIRTWGPIGLGLAAVPALPYMFDEPVEKATEFVFHKAFELVGGPSAVGHTPETGREALLQSENKSGAIRDKEL
ncbi:hypothetical protein K461DRAFT_267890 [Myriangium duriaei CBS 260.36]|uniref:Mitochondrial fission process protein 1 n=1 Tax=Myriangium duriaei CBS 260.36 TaxID=1168546 RepID=A0A9P4J6G3_9PEZI|nr:hypothetical protein K461DRAFT_267890 [Myriangium duriaei CBS 260.36]